jgi:hypothetical protein
MSSEMAGRIALAARALFIVRINIRLANYLGQTPSTRAHLEVMYFVHNHPRLTQ